MAGNTRRLSDKELAIFDKTTGDIQAEFLRQAERANIKITLDGRSRNLPSSKDTGRFLLNYNSRSVIKFVRDEIIIPMTAGAV